MSVLDYGQKEKMWNYRVRAIFPQKYHTNYEGESPLIQGLFESLQHA